MSDYTMHGWMNQKSKLIRTFHFWLYFYTGTYARIGEITTINTDNCDDARVYIVTLINNVFNVMIATNSPESIELSNK